MWSGCVARGSEPTAFRAKRPSAGPAALIEACAHRAQGYANIEACAHRAQGYANIEACAHRAQGYRNIEACAYRAQAYANIEACAYRAQAYMNEASGGTLNLAPFGATAKKAV